MSASSAGNNHSTPSAPTPLWRSQRRRVNSAISGGAAAPSIIRKSLPQALALVKGILNPLNVILVAPHPAEWRWLKSKTRAIHAKQYPAPGAFLPHQTAH